LYLVNASDEFKKLILDLLNLSSRTKSLPDAWKIARISMIPKKKANSPNPKDYRPVSVTSCLGKLSERLVLKRLNTFIEENELIIKQQSGFRKHRQTRDNLFHFIQKTIETFERKKKVCAIFFDIQAAFDNVWHKGLLYKMIKMKIPIDLILWLRAFLDNRKFFVNIGNTQSQLYDIKAGVPQGAVLSPLLFSIYINDIPTKYNKNKSYSLLFADDLVSYFIFDKYNNIQKAINAYIKNIEQWLSLWRLSMAAEKCNYIIFSSTKKNLTNKLKFKMFNKDLTPSDNICFLGIRFDHNLSFKNQVEFLKKNCQQRLNCLKILSHKTWKLSKDTLKQIYYALVRSVLDYSSVILPRISATNRKNLQRIQNCAIKVTYKLDYRENTQNIHRIAEMQFLEDRFRELNGNYLNDSIENENPLINDLINEYKLFKRGRNQKLKFETILCNQKL
jgi:hypothetical protein